MYAYVFIFLIVAYLCSKTPCLDCSHDFIFHLKSLKQQLSFMTRCQIQNFVSLTEGSSDNPWRPTGSPCSLSSCSLGGSRNKTGSYQRCTADPSELMTCSSSRVVAAPQSPLLVCICTLRRCTRLTDFASLWLCSSKVSSPRHSVDFYSWFLF